MDYAGFRDLIRSIYDFLYEKMIPTLVNVSSWFFKPVGTALDEVADMFIFDPMLTDVPIRVLTEFLNNNVFFQNLSMAELMLGTGLLVYLGYSFVKFLFDIIF